MDTEAAAPHAREDNSEIREMLKQAHESLEMMSALASAVKDERWGDAERVLRELKVSLDVLTDGINSKAREGVNAPSPDKRDRG